MLKKITIGLLTTGLVTAGIVAATRSISEAVPEGSESAFRTTVLAHEVAIAECMADRGFEYVASIPADVLLEEARAAAEAEGRDLEEALEEVDLPEDPNEAIIAALPADRAEAYADAYWGTDGSNGCYYSTYEQAWGVDIRSLGSDLDEHLPAVEAEIASDERVVAAKEAFLECMAREGYAFDRVEDVRSYEGRQTAATVQRINGPGGGSDVPADHADWLEHVARMERFADARSRCEPAYTEVVRPIENAYLSRMAEEVLP